MRTVYVSASGGGDGTFAKPFDINNALKEIYRLRCGGIDERITVYYKAGTYNYTSPILLTSDESNITFTAEKGTELNGCINISDCCWELFDSEKGIYVTRMVSGLSADTLFVNGKMQVMARYPNYEEGVLPLGGSSSESGIKARSEHYLNPQGGYIRAIHVNGWGGNSYIIKGKNELSPTGLDLLPVGDNNRGFGYDPSHLVVENIFEELDCENEWYYDKTEGLLYFIPEKGVDLSSAKVEIAVNHRFFELNGVENTTFEGFTFTKTSRTMFLENERGMQYVPLMRGDWCVVRSGALLLKNCSAIEIKSCNFSHINGNAIFISGKNDGHSITNCRFTDTGASCIQIAGMPLAVWEPSFWSNEKYRDTEGFTVHKTTVDYPDKKGNRNDLYARNITVSDCYMRNIGVFEKQSCGVNISVAKNVKVLRCTIHDSARSCININDGTFGGHEIAYNDIFDAQRETTDHGPFNSWGRDRFWSVGGNFSGGDNGKEASPYAFLDAAETTVIHNNRFYHAPNAPHSWGIDLDDGSSNYEIYQNLVLGAGIKLREGFGRYVHNNILVGGQFQIHCTYAGAEDRIENNIVVFPKGWGFAGQSDSDMKRLVEGGYRISGNIYWCPNTKTQLPDFFEKAGFDCGHISDNEPEFMNTAVNDYTVRNETVLAGGFENFDMHSFGCKDSDFSSPVYVSEFTVETVREFTWKGAKISSITQAIMSATATGGTDGVYFVDVPENSEAHSLGYRSNRILKEMNGIKIKNPEQLLNISLTDA